ncbi:MAG: hypothetical protein AAGG51_12795 [Cyanobacteria bacterium P01_G01_bin.54]
METWEFLLQKQGTRSWLPLQTRKVSLGTGHYRLVAQGCPPSIDVEIQVFYQTFDTQNPQRRSQKRVGRTSEEGLIVIVPFTELRPGLWELQISSPQVRALWGTDWQDVLQIKVKPAPTTPTTPTAVSPTAAKTPIPAAQMTPAPDNIPRQQRAAAYQPRFSLAEPAPIPPETNPAILLEPPTVAHQATVSLPPPGVSDQEAQPWLANLPPLALIDTEQASTDPEAVAPPLSEPPSSQPSLPAALAEPPRAEASPSSTADKTTTALRREQSVIALTPEILAADAVGFEPPQAAEPETSPAALPLESELAPELTNNPHALLEQSIQSLEQILQQVNEPGEATIPASSPPSLRTTPPERPKPEAAAVSSLADVLETQPVIPTPAAAVDLPSSAAAAEKAVAAVDLATGAIAPEIAPEQTLLPLSLPTSSLTPTALPSLLPLEITLAEDTFIRHRNEPILISGHVDVQTDAQAEASSPVSSRLDQGFSGFLHYELRDPQTQAELLTVEQPLQDATLPLVFNYLLDVPTAYATRLVLGEVRLTITDPVLAPPPDADRPLAQQTFSITAGLADLLDTVRQNPTMPVEPAPLPSLRMPSLRMPTTDATPALAGQSWQPEDPHSTPPTVLPPKLPQSQAGSRKLPELPSFGNPPPAASAAKILPWGLPEQQSASASPQDGASVPGEWVLGEFMPEDTVGDAAAAGAALETSPSTPLEATPHSTVSSPDHPDVLAPSVAAVNLERYQPIPELSVAWDKPVEPPIVESPIVDPSLAAIDPSPELTPSEPTSTEPDAFEALQLGDRFRQQLSSLAADPLAAASANTAANAPAASSPATVGMPTEESRLESDWPMQEFVVDDEPDDALEQPTLSSTALTPRQYDASGLPYPQQFQSIFESNGSSSDIDWLSPDNPPPAALVQTTGQTQMQTTIQTANAMPTSSTPPLPPATPALILPQGELIAGDLALVRVTLKAQPGLVYVKLWVKDCETRQLLDGPRAFVDFETIAPGELETMTQVVVPLGSPAIQFEAIAIDVTTGQESRKASCERAVVPPDFSQFNIGGNLEEASALPLSEG